MNKIKILYIVFSLLLTFSYGQKAELITQQINVENAIRGKVENTVNKFLDASQYIVLVNARLEFKPISMGSLEQSDMDYKDQDSSPYSLIPGLDMPGIPTKQKIYQQDANYWYLMIKPGSDTILTLFPAPPWHIPYLAILALIMFVLSYWTYLALKRLNKFKYL